VKPALTFTEIVPVPSPHNGQLLSVVVDSNAFVGSLLEMVMNTSELGAPFKVTLAFASRLFPTVTLAGTSEDAPTLAVMLLTLTGVAKPLGVPAVTVVAPTPTPWNVRLPLRVSPPVNCTDAGEIVPTLVAELDMGTVTNKPPTGAPVSGSFVAPPRTSCVST